MIIDFTEADEVLEYQDRIKDLEAEVERLKGALTSVREMLIDGQGEADALLVIDAALEAKP